ncbi:glutathione S-transferase family protein [Caulobacter sp. KR2-114]|uniref:glutathione S-transferase family protein n=1 Tax=Caulobacter sp. KR2-114 TaxID=3400912 RepID=UPI003C02921D
MDGVYEIHGALGSPYSLKVRAVLRYRRLPHIWRSTGLTSSVRDNVKVPVIPVIRFPDGSWRNDSTPVIAALEAAHADRGLVPDDPADAFLAFLIEDMADEWGTKAMFHYRWAYPEDVDVNAFTLVQQSMLGRPRAEIDAAAASIRDRQVGRMPLVGCTPANAPLIEENAHRVLALIDAHLDAKSPDQGLWLFGQRPSIADFGWYGQLSQLARDPTPRRLMRERYPAAFTWVETLDDASGLEPGPWRDPAAPPSAALQGLLAMASDVYLPFLAENARALADGRSELHITLAGHPYAQAPFGYQAKCLAALKAAFQALAPEPRRRVETLLCPQGVAILAA